MGKWVQYPNTKPLVSGWYHVTTEESTDETFYYHADMNLWRSKTNDGYIRLFGFCMKLQPYQEILLKVEWQPKVLTFNITPIKKEERSIWKSLSEVPKD